MFCEYLKRMFILLLLDVILCICLSVPLDQRLIQVCCFLIDFSVGMIQCWEWDIEVSIIIVLLAVYFFPSVLLAFALYIYVLQCWVNIFLQPLYLLDELTFFSLSSGLFCPMWKFCIYSHLFSQPLMLSFGYSFFTISFLTTFHFMIS